MLKIMRYLWDKNANQLRNVIESLSQEEIQNLTYEKLVGISFQNIVNDNDLDSTLNIGRIHEIDDGDYQGTLIYLTPFDGYQPDPQSYLMTYVYYGSCSGCDTLMSIQADVDRERQTQDIMRLCLDLIRNTVKPYNGGWRGDKLFDGEVEYGKEDV